MGSTQVKVLEVHPDLEEEWKKVITTDGKKILELIDAEIFGSSKVEGTFILPEDTRNNFAEAARIAYQYHLPLSLSPDQVWLAIAQGFANHVNTNAEALRSKFVDFDGKKTLTVSRDTSNLFEIEWAGVISEFSGQIKENIGEKSHSTLTPQFSTTKDNERVACEVTLMDTMQSYFEYEMACGCGISKVRLLGTLEDWTKIKQMMERLREYDIEWWINVLIPVLDKFISAYEGEIDKTFWNDIYVYRQGRPSRYSPTATGWIVNFFPYLGQERSYKNTDMFEVRHKGLVKQEGPSPDSIPSGLSKAPIKVIGPNDEITMCTFVSGFFGIEVKNGFISPYIAWAVTKQKESDLRQQDKEEEEEEEEDGSDEDDS